MFLVELKSYEKYLRQSVISPYFPGISDKEIAK